MPLMSGIYKQHHFTPELRPELNASGVTFAVMENEFYVPAFNKNLANASLWYDAYNKCNGIDCSLEQKSRFYSLSAKHGTHVVGLISGEYNGESLGFATGATIIPVCAISHAADLDESKTVCMHAFQYLTTLPKVEVINLSQELTGSNLEQHYLMELVKKGCVIVYAAGNQSRNLEQTHIGKLLQNPILRKGVLVVGNVDSNNRTSVDSNTASSTFQGHGVLCNGQDRVSIVPDEYKDKSKLGILTGTSQAAPTVAGAIGLLIQQNPGYTNAQLMRIVTTSGEIIDSNSPFRVLHVDNMLNPELQQSILAQPPKTIDPNLAHALGNNNLPALNICINHFPFFKDNHPSAKFVFRKLIETEIITHVRPDLMSHIKEPALIKHATDKAVYGIVYTDDTTTTVFMATLAVQMDQKLFF